jgi:hypothetical protein
VLLEFGCDIFPLWIKLILHIIAQQIHILTTIAETFRVYDVLEKIHSSKEICYEVLIEWLTFMRLDFQMVLESGQGWFIHNIIITSNQSSKILYLCIHDMDLNKRQSFLLGLGISCFSKSATVVSLVRPFLSEDSKDLVLLELSNLAGRQGLHTSNKGW